MHTLVLIDASPVVHRIIELTFSKESIRVLAAGDGESGMAVIRAERPDVVLVDQAAPGRNGYEVSGLVKADVDLSHIPVLLLAGAFEPIDPTRAAQCGCAGVLVKPLEPRQVVMRVKDLIRGSSVPADADEDVFDEGRELPTLDRVLEARDVSTPRVERPEEPGERADFEALAEALGARRGTERTGSGQELPSDSTPPVASMPVSEELIDEVTRRVVERLAPDAMRPLVTDIVVGVAERMVREEIERIRRERTS
jgi:DNA-binding response OmpR family regulator